jgi:hypothetical protein
MDAFWIERPSRYRTCIPAPCVSCLLSLLIHTALKQLEGKHIACYVNMDPAAVNCNRVITQCLMLSVTACKSKFAGFTLISNPFEVGGQHQWVRRCLEEYPQYPNKCNIDNDAHQSDKTR